VEQHLYSPHTLIVTFYCFVHYFLYVSITAMVSSPDSVVVNDRMLHGNWEGIWKEAVWHA
jgi:hypothetical protein